MVVKGTVTNGVVVLEPGVQIPDGTRVDVTPADEPTIVESKTHTQQWLLEIAGMVDDLPADFAAEHDHYIHGTPKRGQQQ
jgi:hypothetical protein